MAKNGTITGGQTDIEVRLKVDMYNFTASNIRILYIKLSLNTLRWDGLCDGKEGG